ncbi:MAG: helix-turn-helix domain-containing protein [Coriobacteriia bacterium]|nr:helix-turn-helix domain-containing protein [Coriobacteriia bacterium]
MTSLIAIGNRLVEARVAQELTQRQLAERVGVHQQQIALWERDRYACVSLARLSHVADALGVTWAPQPEMPLMAAEAGGEYGGALGAASATVVQLPVRDLGEVVTRIRSHVPELVDRYGITRIAVFGSFARGQQRADSDVDLIVEVEHPTLETVFGAEERLASILGRKVDAGSLESLRPRVQPHVVREAVDVWSA